MGNPLSDELDKAIAGAHAVKTALNLTTSGDALARYSAICMNLFEILTALAKCGQADTVEFQMMAKAAHVLGTSMAKGYAAKLGPDVVDRCIDELCKEQGIRFDHEKQKSFSDVLKHLADWEVTETEFNELLDQLFNG